MAKGGVSSRGFFASSCAEGAASCFKLLSADCWNDVTQCQSPWASEASFAQWRSLSKGKQSSSSLLSLRLPTHPPCRPPLGIKPSSLAAYLRDSKGRGLSVASGLLAGAGDLTQFLGGQTAGYAAAMMVMAYPVLGVLWGLLRFKELRGPKQREGGRGRGVQWGLVLVVAQVVLYVLSVGLLSGSAELRSH